MFRVFRSEWYGKKFSKLDKSEQDRVAKFEQQLKAEPYSGKPLGYKFFREKKFDGKRLLFLVCQKPPIKDWWHIAYRKRASWFLSMLENIP